MECLKRDYGPYRYFNELKLIKGYGHLIVVMLF